MEAFQKSNEDLMKERGVNQFCGDAYRFSFNCQSCSALYQVITELKFYGMATSSG